MGYDILTEPLRDERPTDHVFVRVRSRLLQIARKRGCSHDDAEDIVQDAMLACLRRWNSLRSHADAVIEDYLMITVIRIADRRSGHIADLELTELAERVDHTADPCDVTLRRERQRVCTDRLSALPAKTRQIVLARLTGMSWDEVGERCGITPTNARLIYHRTIKLLRERVEPSLTDDRRVA